jgi:hypothetical protein
MHLVQPFGQTGKYLDLGETSSYEHGSRQLRVCRNPHVKPEVDGNRDFREHTKSVKRFIRPFTFDSQDGVLLRLLGVNVHHFVKERMTWLKAKGLGV